MYVEAMDAVTKHLVKRSKFTGMTYTSELIPERREGGDTLVPYSITVFAYAER